MVKIIFLGSHFAGKSTIILRYHKGIYNENIPPTIGGSFVRVEVHKQQKSYILNIWDTSGQEKYDALTSSYFKGTNIAIITIDCKNMKSLQVAKKFYQNLVQEVKNCRVVLAVNKVDLLMETEFDEEQEFK